ncbi:DUF4129 domain-containing protein [Natronococcus occultus]|uniref:Protein-glutamine gamma-glutamyltransferase-like C-terminal domain-containing protein n=1 Tax=Natronococcus occultus SP4 TaxID=694430 RepID=L0JX38_9EURY|nr:DUF4129 domain-containing protein [Natronococcus occultus]AGB37612.1 hypothetical protein Natoc_1817 [Natronococcus occultus SP4]
MSRNELLVRLVAAVAAIVAIGLAAATVRSPLETGGSGGAGTGEGEGTGVGQPPETPPESGADLPPFLEYLLYAVVLVAAVALVWYLLANRRDAVRLIAIALVAALLAIGLAYALAALGTVPIGGEEPTEDVPDEPGLGEEGGEPGEGEGDRSVPTGPLVGVLVVLAAVFVGGVLLTRNRDDPAPSAPEADAIGDGPRSTDAAAVGSAAGRAADRIDEGTAVDNEVYRAWREMTDRLDVDRPASSTPREFADAAVAAGLERDHVDELTRLFEDVRYGDTETTPAMERQAVATLRKIEAAYADGDSSLERDDGTDGGERR